MNIINVDSENLMREHICCAISDKKGESCVSSKKEWMQSSFKDGLVFKKVDVRGKVFIEYIPAENAWAPISAESYMYINCFWVSGQYKGQGHANRLLEACIEDSRNKNKKGLVVLSSKKKMPFLSDPQYLKHKGFQLCDTVPPHFELLYLPFEKDNEKPSFKDCCREASIAESGFVLYYSNQCPHTEKYAPLIANIANARGIPFSLVKLAAKEEAQRSPAPFSTYSLFYNGKFITNEILSENKFTKLLQEKGY